MALFSQHKFHFIIRRVNDSYQWGAHTVPRQGNEIVLTRVETSEVKRFFIATDIHHDALSGHMNSLTDDLLEQWFNKREKKPKKEKA